MDKSELLNEYNDFRFTVILKARQLGISTITAAYCVWMMLFHRDKNVLVMATKFGTASNLVKKVKAMKANKGAVPDLSGDGKVTQKDILIGRKVIKKRGGGAAIRGMNFKGNF